MRRSQRALKPDQIFTALTVALAIREMRTPARSAGETWLEGSDARPGKCWGHTDQNPSPKFLAHIVGLRTWVLPVPVPNVEVVWLFRKRYRKRLI
jgi:hypothetical protein